MNNDYFRYKNNFKQYEQVKSELIVGNKERKETLITIAIPTYKRSSLIEKAIKSAIDQVEFEDYEIIIVDNAPDAFETEQIVCKFNGDRIYYFKNEQNIGMFGNWNRCIELAKGKYISILNDDDWLSENYLKNCVEYLASDTDGLYFPSFVADYRDTANSGDRENYSLIKKILSVFSRRKKKLTLFDFFLGNKSLGSLGILMKTENLKKLGGYNENYYPSSDYVLHSNYCYNYNVYLVNEKLNYYRIAENESAKQDTLRTWEYIDKDIRDYFIGIIGKRKKILGFLNQLIQENKVEGMVKSWNYKTDSKRKHNILRKSYSKIISLKYYLNI